MPNGLKIVLPTTLSDTSLPVLRDDAILTAGSLCLYDLAHSANPTSGYVNATSGVPTSGALLNNVAWKEAATLLGGSPAQSALAAAVTHGGLTSTAGKVERTALGALHAIFSQTNNGSGQNGLRVDLPTALLNFLFTNYDHDIFTSLWFNETRASTDSTASGTMWHLFGKLTGGATTNYKSRLYQGAQAANQAPESVTGLTMLGYRASATPGAAVGGSNTGMRVSNFAIRNHSATAPTSNTDIGGPLWVVGNGNGSAQFGANIGANIGKSGSGALYRIYMEDLTVSGRSYAAVDALDFAAYTRDVLTAGGRYNGDTISTAPSTIP